MSQALERLIQDCLETVGRHDLTVVTGAQNVALIGAHQVWRFPRRRPSEIHDQAQRCISAGSLGLGAPEVLDVVPGEIGTAHLVLRRVAGTPLLHARPGRVAPGVLEALARLREAHNWPWTPRPWGELWRHLAEVTEEHRASLTHPSEMTRAARHAAAIAASAPLSLLHADLASDNLLLRDDGGFAGLLDWDSAVLGDQAMDVAAVLHVVSARDAAIIQRQDPTVTDSLHRYSAYAATWPLQEELWRLGLMPLRADGTAR